MQNFMTVSLICTEQCETQYLPICVQFPIFHVCYDADDLVTLVCHIKLFFCLARGLYFVHATFAPSLALPVFTLAVHGEITTISSLYLFEH